MSARKKKLINQPENILQEMLEGVVAAYPDIIRLTDDGLIVRAEPKATGKVALVIGNGTGHEPAMIGLIGKGWFDVNIPGEIFAAPGPNRIVSGIKAAERGAGVLVCVSHHAGDLMNAEMALELCEMEGIDNVEMVVLYDDISSAPKGSEPERRGTAGLFFVWKMLGAYAEGDVTLAQCKTMAEKIRDNTRSLAVALTPGTNPVSGEIMFELADDEIEIGMGVHGEVGQGRRKMCSADDLIDIMLPPIINDLPFVEGDEVLVLINDSGSMTQMELFILFRRVAQILGERGITVYKTWIGAYATTQEMAGFALSLCRVDDELKTLWDAPAIGANVRIVQA
ncbi:MAG: dihydroxyacetone kinase subunit DhaK [Anaerolineae bacterium]|nr:dihydroxyacetone kinase subunit DhaK [Anaerolineae bacterium]